MAQTGTATHDAAYARIERFRKELGPFVVAAETTRMPMIFTDGHDLENPIVFANDAFLALTGFARDVILGQPLTRLLGDVTDTGSIASIRSAIGKGDCGTWEMPCRCAGKGEFLAAVFLSPVRDAAGVVRQNFLSFVALEGHVERLLAQRNELQALYELAPGFIATVEGPDHRFTFANASYKRFVGRDHLEGLTAAAALPELIDQGVIELLDQVYRSGVAYGAEDMPFTFLNPTTGATETRYANFVYQAVRDARNVVTGLFCEGYDVTAQHKTAATLAMLQSELIHVARVNAMGTMAATLAHELNQPLSAVANYTAGMQRLVGPKNAENGQLIQALQGIDEASQRAAEIIRNLRELTRRREPTRASFDLRTAVDECLRLVRVTAEPGLLIVKDIPEGVSMTADRVQIQQVIINLLRNACDAVVASVRHKVSIIARQIDNKLVVSVIDTGPGVPVEAAANIFSWSDSEKEGGMGLGLSICRTIIENHRGRIWLQDSGPTGSEFRFSVPVPLFAAPSAA